jgi:hypothetical protein
MATTCNARPHRRGGDDLAAAGLGECCSPGPLDYMMAAADLDDSGLAVWRSRSSACSFG